MATIQGEIFIDRPPAEVFDVLADPRNEPRYNPRIVGVDKLTEGPVGVGSRFASTARTLGREGTMTVRLTGYDRPRLLTSTIHSASMDIKGELTLRQAHGGTLARWRWDMRPHGLLAMAGPVLACAGLRTERRVWRGLKRYLEAGAER
ncbi:carbon monoxide dehydrogenase subunit G [Saccharomonospora amisosensis]|uniref:Carbon monoxide dehydrogenase subunit G n=1 Tax=Saccharomonospora amisosensis TaxID=1128677 RepID=A0A7X5UPX3_9PSEU|nr:SRPBCC family protein [Saccharomonospora amisosensis]NIJ12000.1 carbon monoxide dehydrogenase subunit G [Saccharomonospora amisosensis]